MSDVIDIIISAVDQASDVFNSIVESATGMGDSISDATVNAGNDFDTVATNVSGFSDAIASVDSSTLDQLADSLGMDTDRVQELIDAGANVGSIPFNDAAASAEELGSSVNNADNAVQGLGSDLDIINSSMLLQLGDQLASVASGAEDMAQEMNENAISVGQLATQAGIAEPQMVSLINNISNATFPNDEAMMYVKSLDQIGVSSENLGQSATDLDKINDAFGMGANTVNSLGQELSVLGVDMNNVSSSFNALAYANANTVGGMDNYYNFLRKYDAQFKELGFNVDQASVIIAGATQKFGGGRAALSGLSTALKESNGDTRALEEALGLEAGSIENATQLTGEYEGQLQQLADEEAEHKTILDQVGAAWEDLSLAASSAFSPVLSVIALVGQVGSFGIQVKGLQELVALTRRMTEIEIIDSAVKSGKAAIMSVVTVATTLYASIVGVLTGEIGLVAAATAVWNAILAMNPVMLVVIALVALVAIIYEVGKAFGWWSDVQGMMSAIWDGINRIWQAFINHPDVQATIQAIIDVWNWLVTAVQEAGQSIMDFFGINEQGNFDVVRTLIDAIGQAWQAISLPLRTVIGMVQQVIGVFDQFRTGQIDLPTLITTILTMLGDAYNNMFRTIVGLVVNFGMQILRRAVTAATNFVRAIVTRIMQLPGRIRAYLFQVAMHVLTMGQQWVVNARLKALALVTAVVTGISSLPGHMLNTLSSAVSAITSAGQQWITEAKNKAGEIVSGIRDKLSGVSGAISGALSGVASAITAPFRAAWDRLKPIVDKIKEAMKIIPGGGQGGMDLDVSKQINIADPGKYYTPVYEGSSNNRNDVNINFTGLPSTMSERQLVNLLTSKGVIDALVNNNNFQSANRKATTRYNARLNRSG